MDRAYPASSLMRGLKILTLLVTLAQGCGPDPRPVLHVSLDAVPTNARTLRVETALDGAARAGATFAEDLSRFSLRLLPGERGLLLVEVAALGGDGCVIARSEGQAPIQDDTLHALTMMVRPLPIAECGELLVQKDGDGDGLVMSSPEGILCGDRCGFAFAPGQAVRLTARSGATSYFDGWAGGCGGLESCQVITRRETPRAVATFTRQVCTPGGWCWENPLPHGYSQAAIWGSGADNVWSVGEGVLRWDGTRWRPVETGLPVTSLNAIWGSGNGDLFATGWSISDPVIVHFDGTRWQIVWRGKDAGLTGVWGSGPKDVFVVGYTRTPGAGGLVLRWNGESWQRMSGTGASGLNAVWGSGPGDVYAVGYKSTILHFDGQAWTALSARVESDFLSIWGSGPRDVFFGGRSGTIVHFDGQTFVQMRNGGDWINGLWGSGPKDVFAIVSRGLLHFDGESWRGSKLDDAFVPSGLWGSAPDQIIGVGWAGRDLRWNGHDWLQRDRGPRADLIALWGSGSDDIWGVGGSGQMMHWDGVTWRGSIEGISHLLSISGSAPDNIVVGEEHGLVLRYDGRAWEPLPWKGFGSVEMALWTGGRDQIWVAGLGLYHWDGTAWQQSSFAADDFFYGIWGSAADNLFAVGEKGRIIHFDGKAWRDVASGSTATLVAVWGSGPQDVYAAGEAGALLHGDRHGFAPIPSGTVDWFTRIHGSGPKDVYVQSNSGVYRWDGVRVTALPAPPVQVGGIWVDPSGSLLAAGQRGAILRYRPTEAR